MAINSASARHKRAGRDKLRLSLDWFTQQITHTLAAQDKDEKKVKAQTLMSNVVLGLRNSIGNYRCKYVIAKLTRNRSYTNKNLITFDWKILINNDTSVKFQESTRLYFCDLRTMGKFLLILLKSCQLLSQHHAK